MLDKLLTVVTTNAKLVVAGAIGAALVAGGGAVAVTQVASSSDSSASAEQANEHSDAKGDNRSDTATAHIDLPKPPKTEDGDTEGAQGVHGACVSAVAKAPVAAGAASNAHGKAVSLAAHTCPKGNETAEAEADTDTGKGKGEAKSHTDADAEADTDAGTDADTDADTGTSSGNHGKSGSHR